MTDNEVAITQPGIDDPASAPGREGHREQDGVFQTQLPADLSSARQVRSAVRRALATWGMADPEGDAELLASELVANAAEHGDGQPITLALIRYRDAGGQAVVSCEVTDTSPMLPQPCDADPDGERGRGLAIVSALATASGVRPEPTGKTTWFTLTLADRVSRAGRDLDLCHELEAGA